MRRNSLMGKIREAVKGLDSFDLAYLSDTLHAQTYKENLKIKAAVTGLKRIGEVETIRPGLWRYIGKKKDLLLISKMWRAMRIKERFTVRDIVRLSGASKTHVHKYFMFLEKKEIIVNSSGDRGYSSGTYYLVDPDQAPLDHPEMPFRKKRNVSQGKNKI